MSLEKPPRENFRPAEQLQPAHAPNTARSRGGEAQIFLSWGGAIYGPARPDEVAAGVRTSWFDKEALFWFEGQTEWRPVNEFPQLQEGGHHTLAGRRVGTAPDEAPPLPRAESRPATSSRSKTRRAANKSGKRGSSRRRGGRGRAGKIGRSLVFGIVLLAAAATVALLFLLMQL
jgi:hypothetical protein